MKWLQSPIDIEYWFCGCRASQAISPRFSLVSAAVVLASVAPGCSDLKDRATAARRDDEARRAERPAGSPTRHSLGRQEAELAPGWQENRPLPLPQKRRSSELFRAQKSAALVFPGVLRANTSRRCIRQRSLAPEFLVEANWHCNIRREIAAPSRKCRDQAHSSDAYWKRVLERLPRQGTCARWYDSS